jgi:hypothetical protein
MAGEKINQLAINAGNDAIMMGALGVLKCVQSVNMTSLRIV